MPAPCCTFQHHQSLHVYALLPCPRSPPLTPRMQDNNVVVKTHGEGQLRKGEKLWNHVDLVALLDIADLDAGTAVAGECVCVRCQDSCVSFEVPGFGKGRRLVDGGWGLKWLSQAARAGAGRDKDRCAVSSSGGTSLYLSLLLAMPSPCLSSSPPAMKPSPTGTFCHSQHPLSLPPAPSSQATAGTT